MFLLVELNCLFFNIFYIIFHFFSPHVTDEQHLGDGLHSWAGCEWG